MRTISSASLVRRTALALAVGGMAARAAYAMPMQDPQPPVASAATVAFSADQLDNLVAPVALYADPLLAQVLLASTFPDQIQQAAAYVRANGTNGIDDQYWDVSVKAVAHYPTILNMMDTKIDWTTSLGQAYAGQSTDVMQAVQHMRQLARQYGNLESSPQQQVVVDAGYIRVWPAQPQVIYVPVYDPSVIYCGPMYRTGYRAGISFGIGYPIGAWLMYDWDWPARRIIYTGWQGGGWIARSRPFISFSAVYVNAGSRHVRYDHDVLYRRPDYGRIHRYTEIHRGVNYDNHDDGRYAVPRDHGVVDRGSGYRQPWGGSSGSRRSGGQTYTPAPRRATPVTAAPMVLRRRDPVPSTPQVRTAQPRRAEPAPAPQVRWAPPPTPRVRSAPAPQRRSAAEPSSSRSSSGRTAHRRGNGG